MTKANGLITMKVAEMASMFPQREISEASILGYATRLSAYPEDLVCAAIAALIETAEWFPTLAQILDAAGLGGNASPPFVLPIGPTTHRPTLHLWQARLRDGQDLRFDRDKCPSFLAGKDPVNGLIWLRSLDRSKYSDFNGDAGYLRWCEDVISLEDTVGVPLVRSIGTGEA